MAVTTEKSTQCAFNIDARTLVNVDEIVQKVRIKRFSFTGSALGDATSTCYFSIPAGRIRVLADQSRLTWECFWCFSCS